MSNHFRPRSASELLDLAFAICRAHAGPLGVLAVVCALPLLVGATAMTLVMPTPQEMQANPADPFRNAGGLAVVMGFSFIGGLWFFLSGASLVHATAAAFRGERVDAGTSLRAGLARGGRVLGANILKVFVLWALMIPGAMIAGIFAAITPALAVLAGIAALVGVVYMLLRLYVVTAVAVLEDTAVTDTLGRSIRLTRGAAGRILLTYFVVFALAMVLAIAAGAATLVFGSAVLAAIVNALWVMVYPLGNIFEAVVYLDQRIRTEGYDIELMSRQLGDAPALPQAARAGQPA